MNALDTICLALDYIETHLQSQIAVADVAAAVGYSIYHFCRTFNQTTHHTPYDYLIRRRLAEAAGVLLRGERRAIDVALDYCFNSPETFSRAFRRVYGLSPRQARKAGRIEAWRSMPRLTRAHLEHLHRGTYLKPLQVEREAVRVAGVMTLLHGGRGAEETLRAWLEDELAAGERLPSTGDRYGIAYYGVGWETRGYSYMAAVEVLADETVPPGLATQVLPAGAWARFVHKGPTCELGLTLDYVFCTWLPRSGCALAQPLVVEQFYQGVQRAGQAAGERAVLVPLAHT
jgi:AraC family transcriptional regulator